MDRQLKPLSLEPTVFVITDKNNLKPRWRQELFPAPLNSTLCSLKATLRHLYFILQCLSPYLCHVGGADWFHSPGKFNPCVIISRGWAWAGQVTTQTLENIKPPLPASSFSFWYHLQVHAPVESYDCLKWGFFSLLNCFLNSQKIIIYGQQLFLGSCFSGSNSQPGPSIISGQG